LNTILCSPLRYPLSKISLQLEVGKDLKALNPMVRQTPPLFAVKSDQEWIPVLEREEPLAYGNYRNKQKIGVENNRLPHIKPSST
jgi:hypothetical protein